MVSGKEQCLEKLERKLQSYFGNQLSIYRSEPFFLEIMPANVNKAQALEKLLKYLKYNRKMLIACGDGLNDISMIEYAGIGVAMVNAQDIEQQQAADSNKEQLSQQNTDNVNIGMSVELPTEPGKKVTVMDVFFSNAQGKFYALFLVIFAVMFATADIKSGYIKNIGGQVSQRGMLIASRAVALALFTAITFAGIFVFQAAANMLAFKCVVWGNWKEIIPYFLTELMLHYAFVLICMAIAVIIKNNVISMTLSVCLTMNIMSIVYALIDYVGNRVGLHNFNIYKYTVTGRMAMLPMNAGREDVISSVCVAAAFIIIMPSLSSYIFQKRDI